jgi:signal transduction histidine kinase
LIRAQNTLRELSASQVEAREEERQRIARELHDELGQRLTALKLELATLDRADSARNRAERTQAMMGMVDDTVAATRRIAMDLRPLMLDDLGLSAAIEWLARDFERHTGLHVTLRLAPIQDLIDNRTATTLYRIVQEALTNCTRHARANAALVTIAPESEGVLLTVIDDGDGFPTVPPQSPRGSFGLIGIRERVYMLGGKLSVSNMPGGGARLMVQLPKGEADELSSGGPPESDGDSMPVPLECKR